MTKITSLQLIQNCIHIFNVWIIRIINFPLELKMNPNSTARKYGFSTSRKYSTGLKFGHTYSSTRCRLWRKRSYSCGRRLTVDCLPSRHNYIEKTSKKTYFPDVHFRFWMKDEIHTVPVKSLDMPTHSRVFLYFYYFLHCRIIVKTSQLWNNTYGIM